eukprot:11203450-Lingulodinium_polyedra.AAC.1
MLAIVELRGPAVINANPEPTARTPTYPGLRQPARPAKLPAKLANVAQTWPKPAPNGPYQLRPG